MFEAYSNTVTNYTVNQPVRFTTPRFVDCRVNVNNDSTFIISTPGCYVIRFGGVGASQTAAAQFTVQLYRNGIAVPGVTTTITSTAAGDAHTLSAETLISILPSCNCVNNTTSYQWVVTSADPGTLNSANIIIYRLK